jgi:hypothetical protein
VVAIREIKCIICNGCGSSYLNLLNYDSWCVITCILDEKRLVSFSAFATTVSVGSKTKLVYAYRESKVLFDLCRASVKGNTRSDTIVDNCFVFYKYLNVASLEFHKFMKACWTSLNMDIASEKEMKCLRQWNKTCAALLSTDFEVMEMIF